MLRPGHDLRAPRAPGHHRQGRAGAGAQHPRLLRGPDVPGPGRLHLGADPPVRRPGPGPHQGARPARPSPRPVPPIAGLTLEWQWRSLFDYLGPVGRDQGALKRNRYSLGPQVHSDGLRACQPRLMACGLCAGLAGTLTCSSPPAGLAQHWPLEGGAASHPRHAGAIRSPASCEMLCVFYSSVPCLVVIGDGRPPARPRARRTTRAR